MAVIFMEKGTTFKEIAFVKGEIRRFGMERCL